MPTMLLMIIVATSLRELSDMEWLAFTHMIGGMVYALYVFKYCPVGTDGRLGDLVHYDANDFALIMVCTIPFAVYFLRPGVATWRRILALTALGIFVLMIIRSGSRGGFLGLIAVMAYTLLRYRAIPARLRLGAVAAGAIIFVAFGSANYWAMMQTILHPNNDYNMTEETGRTAIWKRGLLYMEMRPITGVGVRAFSQAEGELSPTARTYAESGRGIKWSVAHNSFVEIGAELGVIALAAFLGLFFIMFRTLSRVRAGPRGSPWVTPSDQAYAQMLTASFIGFMVCGFFVSAEYFAYLYVLFGLAVAQVAILRRRALRPQSARPAAQPHLARHPRAKIQWLPSAS
jgi:O-antigen ligase